jgi:hypothetical protein
MNGWRVRQISYGEDQNGLYSDAMVIVNLDGRYPIQLSVRAFELGD